MMEHVGMHTEYRRTAARDGETIGELLGRLAGSSAALVRQEIALFRAETKEAATSVRTLAILSAVAGALALSALGSFVAAMILSLGERLGLVRAALVTGGGLLVLAAVFLAIGMAFFRKARARHEAHSVRPRRNHG